MTNKFKAGGDPHDHSGMWSLPTGTIFSFERNKPMTNKYKAGDIVHVRLSPYSAENLNRELLNLDIIAHHPALEPVARWVNVWDDGNLGCFLTYGSRQEADENAASARTCVLRLEWPDGDKNKKPIVTVEDV